MTEAQDGELKEQLDRIETQLRRILEDQQRNCRRCQQQSRMSTIPTDWMAYHLAHDGE